MKGKNKISIFTLILLSIFVFIPLIGMLINVEWSEFGNLISSNSFKKALTNSLFVTLVSTVLSVLIAYVLAYAMNRSNIKHKNIIKIILTLPMLIPSVSHGLGLINLFGKNGIIMNLNIIGFPGIVLGSILYSFPVAFLMLDDGFNYIDNNLYDAAKVLGLNKFNTFKKVTLCYMKKPLLSSIFAVFTMIFTDYGVPLSVGGKYSTLPVFLYKEVIGLLDFSKGTMIGLFLLIPAVISFLFDTFSKNYTGDEQSNKKYVIEKNSIRDILCRIFVYFIILFIICIIGSFVYYAFVNHFVLDKSFSLIHFKTIMTNNEYKYLLNSLIISVLVAIFGTILAYFTAYSTARIKGKKGRIIHILAIASLAIPGIVLGLSYVMTFKNTFIYNTYIILVIVNIVHFFASPYLMAYNALSKVNSNIESVAKTCGISLFNIIKDVIIPCTRRTILEMISYFFVNSMITISAVTFLFNTNTMPFSLLINNYEGNMMLSEAAIVSLIILMINIVMKLIVYKINKRSVYEN